jgi:hypothetical protein
MRLLLLAALLLAACGPLDPTETTETCEVVYSPEHPGEYHVSEVCDGGVVQ